MNTVIRGRVWKFGNNISTDLMYPGFAKHGKVAKEERKWFCMRSNRPEFAHSVQPGDIIVGGKNYGCGSARAAAEILVDLHIGCVLADSFAAIFFRNSIAWGLPVVELSGISEMFSEGDIAVVDTVHGTVQNETTGECRKFSPYPEELLRIVNAGGMVKLLMKEHESEIKSKETQSHEDNI